MYLILILFYTFIPPTVLYYCLKLIYQEKHEYGWHIHYLTKFFITLSFLPILYLPQVDLALVPKSLISVLLFVLTIFFAVLGIKPAIKNKVVFLYFGGIFASFMEEILFRGVIFGLAKAYWNSNLIALIISSVAFGIWHLKNYAWQPDKKWLFIHFLYTGFMYGPIFAGLRILTGDIYLASLFHFLVDTYVALAPKKYRWTILGDRGEKFKDSYTIK
ncbi:MAG: hypothetical protein US96_C0033G0003 [Candidatus Woesebacteria bacterium GW2011_GWB1_38_5b]|uniref:CAAX prenyl protease 2/Lysostaphin resistance protein A-like domain-containing protein n=1 Tax=Candidatus Woesebacteria bacterium GW2011_GWB1_38_5b TaxID=1618569 RepID=A0A0G0NB96_9BACT|nr:MAG: hypothetical protein US96_C0033G0003 [Candidatus Woesebacteria bacterium GW2011_GWB1_38_5b]